VQEWQLTVSVGFRNSSTGAMGATPGAEGPPVQLLA
jgi:hypothetical protein